MLTKDEMSELHSLVSRTTYAAPHGIDHGAEGDILDLLFELVCQTSDKDDAYSLAEDICDAAYRLRDRIDHELTEAA